MSQANPIHNEVQANNLGPSKSPQNHQQNQMQNLIDEIENCIKLLEKEFEEIPWENPIIYAEVLAQSYYQTSHTPRLEALAISRCSANSNFFPLFMEGLQGEIGHESLALQDLNSLGYSIESFPELPATSSFYHSLYYFVNYESILSILGYKLPLEGVACQDSQKILYEKILKLYGASSTSFLKVHDSEDVSHYKQGLEMLQMCESKDLSLISKVCQHFSYASRAITEAILKKHLNK